MGKKTKTLITLSACVLAASFPERAAAQSISCIQPLIFGDIINCTATNGVTITPSGSRTLGGCLASGGAPFSFGRCVVTQNFPFDPIQVSMLLSTITLSNGTTTMTVNNFNLVTNAGGPTATLSAAPFHDIPFGATMNVGAGQPSGTYTGALTINAIFQ